MGLWTDLPFRSVDLHYFWIAILLALGVFGAGSCVSWWFALYELYTGTLAVYVAIFGIAWVLWAIRRGSLRLRNILVDIVDLFLMPADEYKQLINNGAVRIADIRRSLLWSLVPIVIVSPLVYLAFRYPDYWLTRWFPTLGRILPTGWYNGDRWLEKTILFVLILIPVSFLSVSCGRAIAMYTVFMYRLGRYDLVPMPEVVRFRLRCITKLDALIVWAWSVGVMLFVIILFRAFSVVSWVFIVCTALVGVAAFIVPEYSFHKNLERMYGSLLSGLRAMYNDYGLAVDRDRVRLNVDDPLRRGEMVFRLLQPLKLDTWLLNPEDVFRISISLVSSSVALALKSIVIGPGP